MTTELKNLLDSMDAIATRLERAGFQDMAERLDQAAEVVEDVQDAFASV